MKIKKQNIANIVCVLIIGYVFITRLLIGQVIYAKIPTRSSSTDVLKSDWEGVWNCNLDGRPARVEFIYDSGSNKVYGNVSDSNGPTVALGERKLNKLDLKSSRQDHRLPLLYNSKVNWMLMMHTWDRNYASGYTYWQDIPFGFQCKRESSP
jgi:hypothetical protein